jgi:hypothetical protein
MSESHDDLDPEDESFDEWEEFRGDGREPIRIAEARTSTPT